MTDQQTGVDRSPDGSSVPIAGATGGLGSAIARDLDRCGATLTLVSATTCDAIAGEVAELPSAEFVPR